MILFSHAGRVKCCKKDNCYPPLCTKRRATSGNNFNKFFQMKKERPEIQVLTLKLDRISGVLWETTYIGIMFGPRTKLYAEKNDLPIPVNYIDVQRQAEKSLMYFKRRQSMII